MRTMTVELPEDVQKLTEIFPDYIPNGYKIEISTPLAWALKCELVYV